MSTCLHGVALLAGADVLDWCRAHSNMSPRWPAFRVSRYHYAQPGSRPWKPKCPPPICLRQGASSLAQDLGQCFVTRRTAYQMAGGIKEEFGHFSEWLLAANYHASSFQLGFLPEARIPPPLRGRACELKAFTKDFARARCTTLGRERATGNICSSRPTSCLSGNYNRNRARGLVAIACRQLFDAIKRGQLPARDSWRTTSVVVRALGGRILSIMRARSDRLVAFSALFGPTLFSDNARLRTPSRITSRPSFTDETAQPRRDLFCPFEGQPRSRKQRRARQRHYGLLSSRTHCGNSFRWSGPAGGHDSLGPERTRCEFGSRAYSAELV